MNSVRFITQMFKRQAWFLSCLAVFLMLLPMASYADPPPWAPAWGYRNKHAERHEHGHGHHRHGRKHHGDEDEDEDSYAGGYDQYPAYYQDNPQYYAQVNTDIQAGKCDRGLIGGVIGGAAGGYVGSQFGKGDGKLATTAAGALLGFIIGKNVGENMDSLDVRCTGYALEAASDKQKVAWRDPNNGGEYSVTPTRTYKSGDRYCREYTTRATIGGKTRDVYGNACRNPDGSWQVVDQ